MHKIKLLFVTAGCLLGLSGSASATLIASYNFDNSSFLSQVTVASVTASPLTNGAGVPLTLNAAQGAPAPSLEFSFATVGANIGASVTNEDYYSFTITPTGAEVTFNQFDFSFFKTANAGANVQAVLFSSIGGFSTGNEIGLGQLSGTGDSNSLLPRSIDLSSLPAGQTTPVEFRLYVHNSGATNPNNVFRLDNLALDATVAIIPEASAGCLTLFSLSLVAFRRCRQATRAGTHS